MAISRLASQDATNSASTSTVTATYPNLPTTNNLLIAVVSSGVNVATIPNWTSAVTSVTGGASIRVTILYKTVTANDTTTVQASSTGAAVMRIAIYEYNGLALSNTFDKSAVSGSSSSVLACPCGTTANTSQDDELVIAGALWTTQTQTISSWSNSFTARNSVASNLFTSDRITGTGRTYTTTCTVTGTIGACSGAIATFRGGPTLSNNFQFLKVGDGMSAGEKIR